MTSRWILIDDVDSRIDYQGNWEATDGSKFNGRGDWGNVYRNTLHGIKEDGSFSFTYQGTSGRIIGSINIVNSADAPEGFDPQYECILDGNRIDVPKADFTLRNGFELCKWNQETVQEGTHTIVVNVKSRGQHFWFDHIMYIPTPSSSHENEVIMVESWDTNIHYSTADWENLTSWSRMARKGGLLSFHFYGTGVEWSSLRPKEYPGAQTIVLYSFDGNPSTAVVLSGPGSRTHWNHVVFSVEGLPRGFHTLNVQSLGTEKTTPLSLDSLKIQNGTFPEPVDTATPVTVIPPATTTSGYFTTTGVRPPSTATPANDAVITGPAGTGDKNSPPIGPIVGGILGGLAIILLFLLGLLYIRRKVGATDDDDDTRVVTPYTALPAVGPYELADHIRSQTSFSSRPTEYTARSGPSSSQHSPPIVPTPTTTDPFVTPGASRANSRNGGLSRTNSLFPPAGEIAALPVKTESSSGSRSTTPNTGRRQRSRDADRYQRTAGSSSTSSGGSSSSRSRGDSNLNRHNSLFATEPLSALPTKNSMAFQASGSRPSRHRHMPSLPPPIEDEFGPPSFGTAASSSQSQDVSKRKLERVNTLFASRPESPPPLLPEKIMTLSYQHGAMRSQGSTDWHGTDRSNPNPPAAHLHQHPPSDELDGPPPHGRIIMHSDSGLRIPPEPLPNSPPPPISPPLSPPPPIDAVMNTPHYPPTPPPDFH
ncbi:hypothetical protein CVT24_011034 [Panaeolus cyanescens]|uniref:Transmembrane protein n=1 Tax=Panaeolus cyanescens TaxID=181874 RepID=A0A409VG01_9AGAR|nr:hypothetical protein CVT24_011034 [Panaeolus cyanescens]